MCGLRTRPIADKDPQTFLNPRTNSVPIAHKKSRTRTDADPVKAVIGEHFISNDCKATLKAVVHFDIVVIKEITQLFLCFMWLFIGQLITHILHALLRFSLCAKWNHGMSMPRLLHLQLHAAFLIAPWPSFAYFELMLEHVEQYKVTVKVKTDSLTNGKTENMR